MYHAEALSRHASQFKDFCYSDSEAYDLYDNKDAPEVVVGHLEALQKRLPVVHESQANVTLSTVSRTDS